MRLGIAVVYLFDAKTEHLLDLHLRHIRRYTHLPYKIYGSINRLDAKGRELLSAYPEVEQYELPSTNLRRGPEHAFYLDRLVEIAIADGATDVVTLHLDSFPICSDWVDQLKAITDKTGACVATDDCFTACLFFSREFFLRYRPKFQPSHEAPEYPQFLEFVKKWGFIPHSGASYLYTCHTNNLVWHLLKKGFTSSSLHLGDIFGGIICHLQGAVRQVSEFRSLNIGERSLKLKRLSVKIFTFLVKCVSTSKMRKWVLQHGPKRFRTWADRFSNERKLLQLIDIRSTLAAQKGEGRGCNGH